MGLQLLPTEILARIGQETLPEGFESFALTCKSTYNASKFFLPKHDDLKQKYRNFTYQQGPGGNTCTSSLLLLARIAEEPLIARYIVSADLVQDSGPGDENIREQHIATVVSSNILSLFQNSIYVQRASVDPAVLLQYMLNAYQVDDGFTHGGLAACFLLTLLPNVNSLALPERWNDYDPKLLYYNLETPWKLDDLLDSIAIWANDPNQPNAGLSRLEVILPSTSWGYDNRWTLSSFNPLLSIKSVRSFCAGSCRAIDDGYTGVAFEAPRLESFGSGLENVELVGSVVDDIELRKFLSRVPKLRSFKLSYEVKWHGCGHEADCGAIMKAIEDEVGDTLEELSFSLMDDWCPIESDIESMKKFKKLKRVELELGLLIGSQDHENQVGTEGNIPRQRLASVLPPTIERLSLLVEDTDNRDTNDHLNFLFGDIAADLTKGSETFPNLKEITFRTKPNLTSQPLDEQVLSLDGFKRQLNGEESASSPTRDLEDTETAKTSQGNSVDRTWIEDLKAVDAFIQISIIKVGSPTMSGDQIVLPQFMADFCNRYGVESF